MRSGNLAESPEALRRCPRPSQMSPTGWVINAGRLIPTTFSSYWYLPAKLTTTAVQAKGPNDYKAACPGVETQQLPASICCSTDPGERMLMQLVIINAPEERGLLGSFPDPTPIDPLQVCDAAWGCAGAHISAEWRRRVRLMIEGEGHSDLAVS